MKASVALFLIYTLFVTVLCLVFMVLYFSQRKKIKQLQEDIKALSQKNKIISIHNKVLDRDNC